MTNPVQTRVALAEIPDRMGALRVATTPIIGMQQAQNDATTPTVAFPAMLVDNNMNVAFADGYTLSPSVSPDEIVIRQRGRRSLMTCTPDEAWTPESRSPFQRTPSKMPLPSGMILRSSPRKRLTMGSIPQAPTPLSGSPKKTSAKQQLWPETPVVKKFRPDEDQRPLVQYNNDMPLETLLQGYSQQQLIQLIVCGVVTGNPGTEEKLRAQLPMPDIEPLAQELLHAKRNIFKSLPTSRLCNKTDSASYSRAAVHLTEFKRVLGMHTKQLYDSGNWDALLDYVTMAWPCVRGTPIWDNVTHNAVRRQCFKLLSCHCIAAIKNGGLRLGTARLHEVERNLSAWTKDYDDVVSCVNTLNKTLSIGRKTL